MRSRIWGQCQHSHVSFAHNKSAYYGHHDTRPGNQHFTESANICLCKPKSQPGSLWVQCNLTLGLESWELGRQYPHLVYCHVSPVFLHSSRPQHSNKLSQVSVSLQDVENREKYIRGKYQLHKVTFLCSSITQCRPEPKSP